MKGNFSDFFREENGGLSSIRLMSFISLLMAIGITVPIVIKFFSLADAATATAFETTISSLIYILIIWIVGAFAPKVIQKFVETKITNGNIENDTPVDPITPTIPVSGQ